MDIFLVYQKKSIIILGYCPYPPFYSVHASVWQKNASNSFPSNPTSYHLCFGNIWFACFFLQCCREMRMVQKCTSCRLMFGQPSRACEYFFGGLQEKWFLNDQLIPTNGDTQWTLMPWQYPNMCDWVDRKKMLHGTGNWLQLHGTCPGNHIRCVSKVLL